jgi:Arc/MetJ-type ribon-helix-helix transcriptional regulator
MLAGSPMRCSHLFLLECYWGSIETVKLSVSLSEEDVRVLDAYVKQTGLPSRSAAVQRAIRMLRYPALENDYGNAWAEWSTAGEEELWEKVTDDGLGDAAR